MWKVGLVGTGYWSEKHLKAWARIPNVQITALCNRSKQKLVEKGQQFHVPEDQLYTNIDDMLESADIDIVDIVTAPETHLEFVRKVAKAGKHIMCQKPFARSLDEAKEMARIANESGVRLMVTENWRWLQPFQLIKEVLEEGRLGKVHVARYLHSDFYTPRMAPGKELPQPFFREMPNLLFYEMGAHWFDTWRFLFGDPERLYAETRRISPYISGEDTGTVLLSYEDFYGIMDMSWATRRDLSGPVTDLVLPNHLEQLVIEGNLATLKLYSNGDISLIDSKGNEQLLKERTELDHEESHYRLQSHFINCLGTGEAFQTSAEDNVKTLSLIFATYESSKEQRAIKFLKGAMA